MSGGSYDYFYSRLDEFTRELSTRTYNCPHRLAFVKLLEDVSKACHDIEWVDSGDYGTGDEIESIKKVFRNKELTEDKIIKSLAYDQFKDIVSKFLSLPKNK
jgi:hypothetical protein